MDPNMPTPTPQPTPAPAPQPAPAPAPQPAPAAGPQPLFANAPAGPAPAAAGAKNNKMLIIILCIVGGVLILAGIIIAIVFITGSKTLSCENTYESEYVKMTATVKAHYMFGKLDGVSMIEEDWQKDGISDEMIEQSKKTDEEIKEAGLKSYNVRRKDDNTVVVEGEYDLDSKKFKESEDKDYESYEKAKEYFESRDFKCNE